MDYIIKHLIDDYKWNELPPQAYLEKFIDDDRTYLLAAIDNEIIVGYTLAYRFPSLYAPEYMAYLYDIEVILSYRRQGVGSQLVETLLMHLKADGVN